MPSADPHHQESRSARGLPPLHRAPAGRGGAGAVSRNQAGHRPAHRERLLLRFRPRHTVHARGPGKDRSARCGRSRRAICPYERSLHAQGRGPAEIRRRLDEVRADHRARRRHLQRIHAGAAFHRFLPRPARARHIEDQGVQAALHRRRLLEGRRAQQAIAAHLRHGVLLARRTWQEYLNGWKRPSAATIAGWAKSWSCSP